MNKFTKLALAASALVFSGLSLADPVPDNSACQQTGNTVTKVGVFGVDADGKPIIFARVSGYDAGGCAKDWFRFYPGRTDTRAVLAVLSTAKSTGQKVRVDLEDASSPSTAFLAYLE